MQALNYLRQAREYFANSIKKINKSQLTKEKRKDIEGHEMILDHASKAQKFILPDGGRIFNDDLKGLPDLWNLPYPAIVIEYCAPKGSIGLAERIYGSTVQCPKRIVYAEQNGEEITVISITSTNVAGAEMWFIQDYCAIMAKNRKASDTFSGPFEKLGKKIEELKLETSSLDCATNYCPMFSYSQINEDRLARAYVDMSDEIRAVVELVEALSCVNVKPQRIPAKQWRNVGKKKALQFDDYHILTVNNSSKVGTGEARPHGSPREHLRRGHIRKLADGRKLWINSCVVNAGVGGRVFKDYGVIGYNNGKREQVA